MIEINLRNKVHHVNTGTRVIELLCPEEKHDYIVCKIDANIKELNYKITEKNDGTKIELIGLDHIEAVKAYEASLRFVIAMAFHRLYPNVRIQFEYNVSRSIFCRSLSPSFNMYKAFDSVLSEVQKIICSDLPIERISVTFDEAKEIYQKYNNSDKTEILKYRPDNMVNIYKCGDYMDYMHSYMVASTGCIKAYRIKPYSSGLIVQYPRSELGAQIPPFIEEATYCKTLQKAYAWSTKNDLQTIVGINKKLEEGKTLEFVQMCEAKHNQMLTELGNAIESDISNIRLICIAGPSSSGKTTFCNRLKIELMSRGINPVTISLDDYYLEKQEIAKIQNLPADQLDLEHINCLDIELFNRDLFNLINGESVTLPKYIFVSGKRDKGKTVKSSINSPIIIEGIHALNEALTSSIPQHQKYKIFIAPQAQINIDDHSPLNITDLRLIRRIVRDMSFRNSTPSSTIDMWQSVRNGEFQWIYPYQEGADYVFNSSLLYEFCVLRTKALPALREIGYDDPHFIVANRLIKYLKYFQPIEDESIIPCNSLLREFIGGSCFRV